MKKFKTESKRMMDLMINSIYTNREIFLRELLSNCSDAIDKLYYKSLTEGLSGLTRDDFFIKIDLDEKARTITITDNGIGMTEAELENNLGTIAKSGSFAFKNENTNAEDVNIIGQFGVGFYSSFMVAKKVEVVSKSFGSNEAFKWTSEGAEGYDIVSCEKETNGTIITLYLKDNVDEDKYDEFLREYKIKQLVKKYSDYIRYPIKMLVTSYEHESCDCEDENCEHKHSEPKEVKKEETLNSMVPVWKKQKSEVSEGEYEEFYKNEFLDSEKPLKVIQVSAEGVVDYKALLFIPKTIPYNYYTKGYEKGLKLYTESVLITDKCAELLPDYFNFVKGVVDSQLTLNISRETVQHNRQLKKIAENIEKKINQELSNMLKNEREVYEEFFKSFGLSIKFGIYSSFGMNSEKLKDLLLFKSAKSGKYLTLKEYVDALSDDAKTIYYATGKTVEAIKSLPKTEAILERGDDLLCLTDEVDEFVIKILRSYNEKEFKSIESESIESNAEIDKELAEKITELLKDKIVKVKGTTALKNHPICLSSEGEVSIEMEKVFSQMPGTEEAKAQKVLEINVNHPVYAKLLDALKDDNKERFEALVSVMYNQARLIAGLKIDDATKLTDEIFSLI